MKKVTLMPGSSSIALIALAEEMACFELKKKEKKNKANLRL